MQTGAACTVQAQNEGAQPARHARVATQHGRVAETERQGNGWQRAGGQGAGGRAAAHR
jgi:hypothetical protein